MLRLPRKRFDAVGNGNPALRTLAFGSMSANSIWVKRSRSRGATRPSFALVTLEKKRVQGMPGARCTRGLVRKIVQRGAHEHTGSAEALRHSPRNGLTAYAVLSPATNSSCHRRQRIDGSPGPG